ncbi:MAG: TlpA disulfide reductase family protein [Pseudomonadota bacterium]
MISKAITYLRSLRDPMQQMKLLGFVGALFVAYTLVVSLTGAPKPWDEQAPRYLVGEMEKFERARPPRPLPGTTLIDGDANVTLASIADGRVLVINLWATWCAPCLEELPSLDALQAALVDDVQVVAVALEGGDGSAQQAMFDRLGVQNLRLLRDPRLSLSRTYTEGMRLPLTVIYDRQGREIGTLSGAADWSSPEALRLVRAIGAGALPR